MHTATEDSTRARTGPSPPRGVSGMVADLRRDFAGLVGSEAKMAKSELRANVRRAGIALGLIVGGAIAALAGVIVMLMGLASMLSLAFGADPSVVWPEAGGELAIGAVVVAACAITVMLSLRKLKPAALLPRRTLDCLREDFRNLRDGVCGKRAPDDAPR